MIAFSHTVLSSTVSPQVEFDSHMDTLDLLEERAEQDKFNRKRKVDQDRQKEAKKRRIVRRPLGDDDLTVLEERNEGAMAKWKRKGEEVEDRRRLKTEEEKRLNLLKQNEEKERREREEALRQKKIQEENEKKQQQQLSREKLERQKRLELTKRKQEEFRRKLDEKVRGRKNLSLDCEEKNSAILYELARQNKCKCNWSSAVEGCGNFYMLQL